MFRLLAAGRQIGICLLAVLMLACADRACHAAPENTKPNIIFILMDDMGWGDLGCFGHPVIKTPYLDQLAAAGCRLTDFHVPMPICSPTRAACLTGRNPNRYGLKHVVNQGTVNPRVEVPEIHHLPVSQPSLPRQLKLAGYRTGTIGKWHLSLSWIPSEPQPSDYGFDYYFIHNGGGSLYKGPAQWSRCGTAVPVGADTWFAKLYIDEAIRFIGQSPQPFYLHIWPFTPHVREEADERYRAMYAGRTEAEKTYYGCITQMDEQLGRLFTYLQEQGLWEKTVIIFTSDNGPEPPVNLYQHEQARRGSTGGFRGSKHVIYEGETREPGIVRWPGLTEPGSVSAIPVSVEDLLPTLCQATGAAIPPGFHYDGADFRPALKNQPIHRPHPLYWQCEYSMNTFVPHYTSPPLAIREGCWKLMCDLNFSHVSLYNLDWDRNEQFTVDRQYPEIVDSLLKQMKAIYADVNGPDSRKTEHLNPLLLKHEPTTKSLPHDDAD